jgi:hypothetical protein
MVPSPLNDCHLFQKALRTHSWRFDSILRSQQSFLYPLGWRQASRPTESFSKQARAILYVGPGHFDSIQSLSEQLDLSILGNQPRKEELMNSSSRFA